MTQLKEAIRQEKEMEAIYTPDHPDISRDEAPDCQSAGGDRARTVRAG